MSGAGAIKRRTALAGASLLLSLSPAMALLLPPAKPKVEVWKDAHCGCCKDWVKHMEAEGFEVKVNDSGNQEARARLGVDQKFGSCHTASVGGYALEGHVPAREVKRLLSERLAVVGLAVPAMPLGSPGMDGPAYGGRKHAFDVLLLAKDGSAKSYQRYEGNAR